MSTKQNFLTKVHKLAGTDDLRPDFHNIYFKDDYLYVTDAHIALKQHLKYHDVINWENLNGKALHHHVFSFIKNRFIRVVAELTHVDCYDQHSNKVTFQYKAVENDLAAMIDRVFPNGESKEISNVGMNPIILNRLCEGMFINHSQLKFTFYGKNKPIIITSPEYEDQKGLLMPIMLSE